jgi:hypothetical protein
MRVVLSCKASFAPLAQQRLDKTDPRSSVLIKQNQGGSLPSGMLDHIQPEQWLSRDRIFKIA